MSPQRYEEDFAVGENKMTVTTTDTTIYDSPVTWSNDSCTISTTTTTVRPLSSLILSRGEVIYREAHESESDFLMRALGRSIKKEDKASEPAIQLELK